MKKTFLALAVAMVSSSAFAATNLSTIAQIQLEDIVNATSQIDAQTMDLQKVTVDSTSLANNVSITNDQSQMIKIGIVDQTNGADIEAFTNINVPAFRADNVNITTTALGNNFAAKGIMDANIKQVTNDDVVARTRIDSSSVIGTKLDSAATAVGNNLSIENPSVQRSLSELNQQNTENILAETIVTSDDTQMGKLDIATTAIGNNMSLTNASVTNPLVQINNDQINSITSLNLGSVQGELLNATTTAVGNNLSIAVKLNGDN